VVLGVRPRRLRVWRPISEYRTTVKGGERVILSGTYEGRKWIEIGYYAYMIGYTTGSHGLLGVTHWQPLPDFPEE
jgi:hypothetical protein